VTLTFDQVTSNTIGVYYVSWPTTTTNFKIQGRTIHQLLIGNHWSVGRSTDRQTDQQTDRQTDWPTCAKQYTPIFFKRRV